MKQYKKGMKTCEQILAKYPEHGGKWISLSKVVLIVFRNFGIEGIVPFIPRKAR